MRICQTHWDELRKALDDRGIGHLGAKNSQEAIAAITTELEGRGAENIYDPLMDCNNMIFAQALKYFGLDVMVVTEDGKHQCPVCLSARLWIDGPADAALAEAKKQNLI